MSRMVTLALAALLLVIGLVAYDTWRGDKDAKWHADAEREIALGRDALVDNVLLRDSLARTEAARQFALDSAALAKARSDSIAHAANRRVAALRAQIAALDTLPDDPVRDPIIAAQAEVIDSLSTAITLKDAAYRTVARVADELRQENRTLLALNDRLAVRLDSALAVLERRPKERPWWLPEVTAGVTGCWCGGQPEIGPGVTIGKSVRF